MTPEMALSNIRHTAKQLPQSVGSHHRSTLYEAATALEEVSMEMLAALKAVENALSGMGKDTPGLQRIRAVIAKAEGR